MQSPKGCQLYGEFHQHSIFIFSFLFLMPIPKHPKQNSAAHGGTVLFSQLGGWLDSV
jgi:hypothetical protein